MENINNIKKNLTEQIQLRLYDEYYRDKKVNDLFYNLDLYKQSILLESDEIKVVYTISITFFESKIEHDSYISGFMPYYLFTFSNEEKNYVMINNFPFFEWLEIDEEDEEELFFKKVNTLKTALTFEELILYFKEIKKIDLSKIGIEDKDDWTHFD
jgi:hypothetical protein